MLNIVWLLPALPLAYEVGGTAKGIRHYLLVPEAMQAAAGQSHGLMIMGVAKDGPAAKAGVLAGDILLTIGGESVSRPPMVAQRLGPEAVGEPSELRLLRAGTVLSLTAIVATRPTG